MSWLLAGVSGIGFVELMIRLPFFSTLAQFKAVGAKVMAVLSSKKISDHWKERVLPKYALKLFTLTLLIALYLIAAFIPFLLCHALGAAIGVPFFEFAMSWVGIVFITVIAAAYAAARRGRSGGNAVSTGPSA